MTKEGRRTSFLARLAACWKLTLNGVPPHYIGARVCSFSAYFYFDLMVTIAPSKYPG